jgi:hypothetical protein
LKDVPPSVTGHGFQRNSGNWPPFCRTINHLCVFFHRLCDADSAIAVEFELFRSTAEADSASTRVCDNS